VPDTNLSLDVIASQSANFADGDLATLGNNSVKKCHSTLSLISTSALGQY